MRPQYFGSSAFKNLLDDTLKDLKIPGLAIAVIDEDDISVQNFGHAILPSSPITDLSLFDCASTSKSFAAAALALLVDDDKNFPHVKWDTPVSQLLPDDFVMSKEAYTRELTIEDILSHRTGFPNHDDSIMGEFAENPDTPKTVTRNLRYLPINKPMRTEYQYSNIMYTVASYLVEALSGESFEKFLETRLWGPLGMTNTFLQVASVEQRGAHERLTKGYRWDDSNEEYVGLPWWRQHEGQGAGSIFSSVSDYSKWVRCMMHKSLPLSSNSHKELIKPRMITNPNEEFETEDAKLFSHTLYALGWEVQNYRGQSLIGHDGAVNGYESRMCYLPNRKWGLVIFGNGTGASDAVDIICYTLIDELLNIPKEERLNWSKVIQKRREVRKEVVEKEKETGSNPWDIDAEEKVALPLPIAELAGTYHSPGYRTFTFVVEDDQLLADCLDRTSPFKLCLRHVSDTRFSAEYIYVSEDDSEMLKAQFRLRDDGKVAISVGIALSPNMPDDLIWFDKIFQGSTKDLPKELGLVQVVCND